MPSIEIGDRSLSAGDVSDLLATDHPMVEEFRFEEQHKGPGDSLHFALVIIPKRGIRYQQQRDESGRRIEPVWRALSGRERIGQGNRAMWFEGEELVAENCTFFPNQEFNDLGIGSALYVSMERLYRALGIRRVTLLAVDVGVYMWARQGFAFQERGMLSDQVSRLEAFVRKVEPTHRLHSARLEASWDIANLELVSRAASLFRVGNRRQARGTETRQTRQAGQTRAPEGSSGALTLGGAAQDPGTNSGHVALGRPIDGVRVGKYFMLRHAMPWHGIKRLDDERQTAVAEASRRETFSRLPKKIEGAHSEGKVR